ncbi:hypothetical protein B0H11DRAFT_203829 [Mycena galericulata]|nr:hypothetical protein B0H11DRAFT_203829 [Mycena galericulata]
MLRSVHALCVPRDHWCRFKICMWIPAAPSCRRSRSSSRRSQASSAHPQEHKRHDGQHVPPAPLGARGGTVLIARLWGRRRRLRDHPLGLLVPLFMEVPLLHMKLDSRSASVTPRRTPIFRFEMVLAPVSEYVYVVLMDAFTDVRMLVHKVRL